MTSTDSIQERDASRRAHLTVLLVAGAVGFSIMGDSLLYGILPLAAPSLGIPLTLVGVLLSANRLVRLFSNTWVSSLFARFGPGRPFLIATVCGTLAAFLYGVGWGFVVFLAARLLWGVAWSGLRQGGYQAVWAGGVGRTGQLMGLLWGVIRLGSAISVLIGGYLWDVYGYRTAVGVITGLTALAIPLALVVEWPASSAGKPKTTSGKLQTTPGHSGGSWLAGWREAVGQSAQRRMLLIGLVKMLFDSVVVSTASLFLAQRMDGDLKVAIAGIGLGAVAGMVLSTRWLSDLMVGPLLGAVSDRTGQLGLALALVTVDLLCVLTAISLPGGFALFALAVVLILNTGVSVTLDAAANRLATQARHPHHFVGAYTTLSDAGAAVGPLLAYSLAGVVGLQFLYPVVAGLLAFTVAWHWWMT